MVEFLKIGNQYHHAEHVRAVEVRGPRHVAVILASGNTEHVHDDEAEELLAFVRGHTVNPPAKSASTQAAPASDSVSPVPPADSIPAAAHL